MAFLDDDTAKHGKRIDGVPILSADRAAQVLSDYNAKRLIVSIQQLDPVRKAQVIDAALDAVMHISSRIHLPHTRVH